MAKRGRPSTKEAEARIDELAEVQRQIKETAKDTRLGSQLGRLRLQEFITYAEFLAGEAFGELVDEYRRKVGLPKGQPKPNQLQPRVPGGTDHEYPPDVIDKIRGRYDEVYSAIEDSHGIKGVAIVYQVCVNDEWPEWYHQRLLKDCLGTIARKLRQ